MRSLDFDGAGHRRRHLAERQRQRQAATCARGRQRPGARPEQGRIELILVQVAVHGQPRHRLLGRASLCAKRQCLSGRELLMLQRERGVVFSVGRVALQPVQPVHVAGRDGQTKSVEVRERDTGGRFVRRPHLERRRAVRGGHVAGDVKVGRAQEEPRVQAHEVAVIRRGRAFVLEARRSVSERQQRAVRGHDRSRVRCHDPVATG